MRDFRHYEGTSWPDMTTMEQDGQKNNDHKLLCAYVIYMHKQGRRLINYVGQNFLSLAYVDLADMLFAPTMIGQTAWRTPV